MFLLDPKHKDEFIVFSKLQIFFWTLKSYVFIVLELINAQDKVSTKAQRAAPRPDTPATQFIPDRCTCLFILSECFNSVESLLYHLQNKSLMKDSLDAVW